MTYQAETQLDARQSVDLVRIDQNRIHVIYMLLHIFAHVQSDQCPFRVKEEGGEGFGEFSFAGSCRPATLIDQALQAAARGNTHPRNKKDASGLPSALSPALDIRTASDTACKAVS